MVYSNDWVNTNPIDHTKFNQIAGEVRDVRTDVSERLTNLFYGFTSGETQTNEGVKNLPFVVQGSDPGATANKIKAYAKDVSAKAELFLEDEDGNVIQVTAGGILNSVNLTGAQTVAGVKTFSSIPVLPGSDPTADNEAARKVYVDNNISVRQVVSTIDGSVDTTTTTIPKDDTIPQNTEGKEFMTASITPGNSNNTLIIDVTVNGSYSGTDGNSMIAALFQDSTANALAAANQGIFGSGNNGGTITFRYVMTAGTTSSTTFKVRAGMGSAGTFTFNGEGGSRILGGVMASSIVITELAPAA